VYWAQASLDWAVSQAVPGPALLAAVAIINRKLGRSSQTYLFPVSYLVLACIPGGAYATQFIVGIVRGAFLGLL